MEIPDKWLLVKVNLTEDPHWRIFATWHGGFAQGDSWKLNSGISSVEIKDDYYDFVGHSGSVYRCSKTRYGTTLYGMGVLGEMIRKADNKIEAFWDEPENILKTIGME